MTNDVNTDQLASSEANRSGSTRFVKAGRIRCQQDRDRQKERNKLKSDLQSDRF